MADTHQPRITLGFLQQHFPFCPAFLSRSLCSQAAPANRGTSRRHKLPLHGLSVPQARAREPAGLWQEATPQPLASTTLGLFFSELTVAAAACRKLDLPAARTPVSWHNVGSLPLSMKKTQQRCPCVNTVCLFIPLLFIRLALNEIASLHPPGDSLVVTRDILG